MAKRPRLCDDVLIRELLEEELSGEEDFVENDSDDGEVDNIEEQIHESEEAVPDHQANAPDEAASDNDQAASDDDGDDIPLANIYMVKDKDKNVIKWQKNAPLPRNVRTRADNLVLRLPGPKAAARNKTSSIDCFNLFIDDTIVRLIVTSTNIYIDFIKGSFDRDRDARHTDAAEIRAFF